MPLPEPTTDRAVVRYIDMRSKNAEHHENRKCSFLSGVNLDILTPLSKAFDNYASPFQPQ